jgi:two-component system chemotaxis sensor kinase CheA
VEQALVDQILSGIEGLAADLLVQDDVAQSRERWAESLINLAGYARSCGRGRVSDIAVTAAGALRSDSVADLEIAPALERTLAEMRSAIGTEGAPAPAASTPAFSLGEDPELIADFVLEAREHLQSIETQILLVEDNPDNIEALHSIFRSFHTIKGLAGFLELALIQEVAHEVETVLDRARQRQFRINAEANDVILASKDYIGEWLNYLDQGRGGPAPASLAANAKLLGRIKGLLQAPDGDVQTAAEPETETAPATEPAAAAENKQNSRAVKVDTEKLDYLVDMVGEMVIAQSLVRHNPGLAALQDPQLVRNLGQLARITEEVQRTAMSMRMVPIGPLFQRMARLVRDLSRRCGKSIQFECDGQDVELDRNIVEELAEALMHMVRNAVDHGIESEEQRAASGKPRTAHITLRACHCSGQIVIDVSDDGRGIDSEKVLAKARAKGLISADAVLSESEIFNLIFHPGFSTAEKVSDVSGRGVGMDIVRKQIQKLRGSIDIESRKGAGTTFSLRLPLTLAIIDGLVVSVGSERFIIPLASVKEMLRPTAGMVTTVENRAEIVAIRERLLPLVRLYKRFGTQPRTEDPTQAVLIVADVDGISFCLMVDELVGKQEVVIKSLGPVFASASGVAGGAILGDGVVGLILDLKSIYGSRSDA